MWTVAKTTFEIKQADRAKPRAHRRLQQCPVRLPAQELLRSNTRGRWSKNIPLGIMAACSILRRPKDHRRDLAGPDIAAESWWTPERIALLGWLNNNAPALAPLYRGALALAMLGSFPGRVHFIAHAIREMRNRLPGALGPKVERRDAGYDHLANKIRKQWLAEGLPEDGRLLPSAGSEPSASGSLGRVVSYGFLASVGKLIEAHNEAQANREVRERHAFGALSDLGSNPSYVVTNWRRLTREAHKFAHAAGRAARGGGGRRVGGEVLRVRARHDGHL